MENKIPGFYGISKSNRDFSQKSAWGKNQFNSSFPASLSAYMHSKGIENIYLTLDKKLKIAHGKVSTTKLYGLAPDSDDLFYCFESSYAPYEQFLVGSLPRIDLVTQIVGSGQILKPLEIKLTALPDNTTCELTEDKYGTEMVVRPDTIVYLACSIAYNFKGNINILKSFFSKNFEQIENWAELDSIWRFLPMMLETINKVTLSIIDAQEPLLMQPVWKTQGKYHTFSESCLDVFVWSNFAFTRLFLDGAHREITKDKKNITRHIRTMIWLFKMLYDFSNNGQFNHGRITDELSYNTKNDKAFAVSGNATRPYMSCRELIKPRVSKDEIKNIIVGGGQNLLSPERRFDAIIYNSPELFENG